MRRPTFIAICIALASALGPGVRAARAQTADDLFDPGSMQEIRFFINSKDLALLRENWQDNTKYPADMTWRNIRVRNVSVRARGSGSRNPQKPGLQVSFDHYTDGQHFLGLSTLVLKNEWQDASFLRERIAMAFYNRMGFAAPREGWARVYVNNEYWGLYGVVEDINADFLARAFGETPPTGSHTEKGGPKAGYVYEFQWHDYLYWRGEYLGDDPASYKPFFGPVTHDEDADNTLYPGFRDMFREINGPGDAVWRTRVEQYLDLRQFMVYVAIEVYLSEWDGMTGNWGMNNFFIYNPAGGLKYTLIPWDRDHAILQTTGDMSIYQRVLDNVIFKSAWAYRRSAGGVLRGAETVRPEGASGRLVLG